MTERVRARERDPEPNEERFVAYLEGMARKEARAKGQVVLRGKGRPYENARTGKSKYYLHAEMDEGAALSGWYVFEREIEAEAGAHLHQGGLVIYCISGKGRTTMNGSPVEYEAGDFLIMPIVPGGVDHQHFSAVPGTPVYWIAFIWVPFRDVIGAKSVVTRYQPGWRGRPADQLADRVVKDPTWGKLSPDNVPPTPSTEGTLLDQLYAIRDEQRARQNDGVIVIRGKDRAWEHNRNGKMKWYMHPNLRHVALRNHLVYMQEIAPLSRTGRQRKQGNEIIYVVEGRGYTTIDGVKHAWEADDVLCMPVTMDGNVVQHFNADAQRPARFVGVQPYLEGLGADLGSSLEQLEDAPREGSS